MGKKTWIKNNFYVFVLIFKKKKEEEYKIK